MTVFIGRSNKPARVGLEAVVDADVGGVGFGEEGDEEVEVAGVGVEVAGGGGAEEVESLDLVFSQGRGRRSLWIVRRPGEWGP